MTTYTASQKASLQRTADHCFQNGFSSTMFARGVNNTAQILGFDIESEDDFYNMIHGNQPMKDVLMQLGYVVCRYGSGICVKIGQLARPLTLLQMKAHGHEAHFHLH